MGGAPNIQQEAVRMLLEIEQFNQFGVRDITYIPLTNPFAHLALMIELFSRKIFGWSLDLSMEEPLVIATNQANDQS